MTPSPGALSEPQRQSIWAIVFLAFRTVRSIGLVQLLLLFGFLLARLPSVLFFIGAVMVVGLVLFAIAALEWWRYTFRVENEELVVRRGLLQQQRLSMPLERVQSVSLEQKLLHRLISLTQISVDSAGTEAAEFVIDAVDLDVARALQQRVASARSVASQQATAGPWAASGADAAASPGPPQPPPPDRIVLQHSPARILRMALAQMPLTGLILFGPLFAVADDLGRFVPFDLPDLEEADLELRALFWLVPLLIFVGLAISVALNIIRVFLTDFGLTLRSTGTGLRRNAGLLSTTSVAAPIPRIQIIRASQTVLERLFGVHTVQYATIGSATLRLPGCDAEQVADLRSLALGDSPGVQELTRSVSTAEIYRSMRNAVLRSSAIGVALWFGVGWWSLLVVSTLPYEWWAVRRGVRLRRWDVTDDAVADRRQLVGWNRQEALLRKVNMASITQTIFERRRGLATVRLATAAGTISIGMVDLATARWLRDRALQSVETDHRVWM